MSKIRVVLLLEGKESNNDENDNNVLANGEDVKVQFISRNSIVISKKVFDFDYVIYSTEYTMQKEIGLLMDNMLLLRRNCVLIQLNLRREGYQRFFEKMIIFNVYNRLAELNIRLRSIKVKHWNIVEESKCDDAEIGRTQFPDILELKRWLQTEYHQICIVANGHDVLEFEFRIIGPNTEEIFEVKLSICNANLCELNANSINKWHDYMEHLGQGGDQCDFLHTPLTRYLSTHLEVGEEESNGRILFLFNIPTHTQSYSINLLEMANSVMKTRELHRLTDKWRKRANCGAAPCSCVFSDVAGSNVSFTERNSGNALDDTPTTSRSGGVSFTIPVNKKSYSESRRRSSVSDGIFSKRDFNNKKSDAESRRRSRVSDDIFTKRDFNNLSNWYRRIDETFAAVCHAMKSYYEQIYHQQRVELIKYLTHTTSHIYAGDETSERESANLMNQAQAQNSLDAYSNNDSNARTPLKILSAEIKSSTYADTLDVYFATKEFELSQHIIRLKVEQLNRYQQRLSSAVKEELRELNLQLYCDEETNDENIGHIA